MNNPIEVLAESYVDPSKLYQIYYDVENNQKFSLLVHFLKNESSKLVMVFCNTQRNTDFVANNLKAAGINAVAIHGGYSQNKRSRTMQQFHEKDIHVLVCTDVAARGLDIKDVSHIYNYDIPHDDKEYVHRIGRTARAGEEGKAVSLLVQRDYENFQKVLNNRSINIERGLVPDFQPIFVKFRDNRSSHAAHGGYGQRRSYGGRSGGGYRGGGRGYHGDGRSRHDGDSERPNYRSRGRSQGRGYRSSERRY